MNTRIIFFQSIRKTILLLALLGILIPMQYGCVYTPFSKPDPSVELEPLLGIGIATNRAVSRLNFSYTSCDQAEVIREGETKDINLVGNSINFFRLEGQEKTDYLNVQFTTLTQNTCLIVGKENRNLDTNSPDSALDFPEPDKSCSTRYSFPLSSTPGYRCIGIVSFNSGTGQLSATRTEPTADLVASSINPGSARWGELITVTGEGFSSNPTATRNQIFFTPNVGTDLVNSYPLESQYDRAEFQVPFRATSGDVYLIERKRFASITVNNSTMDITSYTRSTPTCTYSPIGAGTGTEFPIQSSNQFNPMYGIRLPFSFQYLDTSFGVLFVSMDGFVSFIPPTGNSGNLLPEGFGYFTSHFDLPDNSRHPVILAPWIGRSIVTSSTRLQYAVQGSAPNRILVVEWKDLPSYSTSSFKHRVNFQIRLFESGNAIEFHYGNRTLVNSGGFSSNYFIGIKSWPGIGSFVMDGTTGTTGTGTIFSGTESSDDFPSTNTCYRFTKN